MTALEQAGTDAPAEAAATAQVAGSDAKAADLADCSREQLLALRFNESVGHRRPRRRGGRAAAPGQAHLGACRDAQGRRGSRGGEAGRQVSALKQHPALARRRRDLAPIAATLNN